MGLGKPCVYDHIDSVCWMRVTNLVQASGGAISESAGRQDHGGTLILAASFRPSTSAVTLVAETSGSRCAFLTLGEVPLHRDPAARFSVCREIQDMEICHP